MTLMQESLPDNRSTGVTDETYGPVFASVYDAEWRRHVPSVGGAIVSFAESDPVMSASRRILDVCCGTGRIACYLAERGFNVVGIDASRHMVAKADANAAGLSDGSSARFFVQDATNIHVDGLFGMAISTLDAMSHLMDLDELKSCFSSVRALLIPGGVYLFDMHTVTGIRELNRVEVRETAETLLVARTIYDPCSEVLVARVSGCWHDGDHWERFAHVVRERAYPCDAVVTALRSAGFDEVYTAQLSDLRVPLDDPDAGLRAFFVARTSAH